MLVSLDRKGITALTDLFHFLRLYDLSILCAEVAAHISALNSEWLGVLKALCCTSMHGLGFDDLSGTIDVSSFKFC